MSESYQEQHPLLCDDLSEEDTYSPHFHRRIRPLSYRGRARHHLKGAAAIITRWPSHWASFLTYWWIGLGMISLTTFVVYNSLFAFPMIQSVHSKPMGVLKNTIETTSHTAALARNVFMHMIVDQNAEINLNEYVPYIEKISNKYIDFNYHLIIVANDTNAKELSAERKNEIAMNSLWEKDKNKKKETKISNINIEYISLTAYMDTSPLNKYWKTLPCHHIDFLVRAVAIWNKGGIAFNPSILTPKSQHSIYVEKLRKILNKYPKSNVSEYTTKPSKKIQSNKKRGHKLNNIRDIINALENEDDSNLISHEVLTETESKFSPVTNNERNLLNTVPTENQDELTAPTNYAQMHHWTSPYAFNNATKQLVSKANINHNITESNQDFETTNSTSNLSLLPLFLEYLFHTKPSNRTQPTEVTTNVVSRKRKSVINWHKIGKSNTSLSTQLVEEIEKRFKNKYEPVIISAKEINANKSDVDKEVAEMPIHQVMEDNPDANRFTIDLKGNIIATDTPCHAFLGTIFSNAVHHSVEESVTDYIIAELSIFCKGRLSSCMGIDVILL